MKIIAITLDQMIIIDGVAASLREHGGFEMARGEWAVHFDSVKGIGEVEYFDNRRNQPLTQAEFDKHYSWLLTEHTRVIEQEKAEQLKAQEAALNEQQATVDASDPSHTTVNP